MAFSKPPRTFPEQLEILKGRGLTVTDESFALHCLAHHNYYRLSAYRLPLAAANDPDQFKPGATFEQLWGLYCFDRHLRKRDPMLMCFTRHPCAPSERISQETPNS
jgi:abortive infection bacteriophage resistance protein